MLRELLARIEAGGFATLESMARELDLPPRELAQMLAKLEELGYLEDAAASIRSACSGGCASCAGCAKPGSCSDEMARVWSLTEKGRRAGPRAQ